MFISFYKFGNNIPGIAFNSKMANFKYGRFRIRIDRYYFIGVLIQMIMNVDFPIYVLRIWVVDGVAMLPSEY